MQFGSMFGGEGAGFINLIMYAIIAVFIVGLMVGRSPEFLGKKIEAREVTVLAISCSTRPSYWASPVSH